LNPLLLVTSFAVRPALGSLPRTLVAALASLATLLSLANGLTADSTAPPATAPARPARLASSAVAR
jgi:hypothetical protein